MKLKGTVNIRVTPLEIDGIELCRQKGITQADIFRRGLDAYLTDMARSSTENSGLTTKDD
jgi:hypothetical protein